MITEAKKLAISKSLKGNVKLSNAVKLIHARRLASGEDALIREKIKNTRVANGNWSAYDKNAWKIFCKEVRNITENQPLHTLENFELRGRGPGKFHLDHIVSKKVGFDLGLPSWFIGNICNLRMISERENCSKQHFSSEEDILNLWFGLTEVLDI